MLSELWADLRYRFRALLRRNELETQLDDELRFHLERETEKNVRLGLSPDDARRRARIAFGGVDRAKEASRDARGTVLIETTLQDLRYALRGLYAKPAFTLGVVLTLGLGIGVNAAMFGIIDRLLFRAPAYLRDASHVHRVYFTWLSDKHDRTEREAQFPRYRDFVRWTHGFESIAAFHTWRTPVGDGDRTRDRFVTAASAGFFDLFNAPPALGRYYTAHEDSVSVNAPVIVLSWAFWQSEFGGELDVLGKSLLVGHTRCTIIGITPEHFAGIDEQWNASLYMPLTSFAVDLEGPNYASNYRSSWIELVVRPRKGVSIAAANADLTSALRRSWIAQASAIGVPLSLEQYKPRATLGPVQLGRGPQAGPDAKVVAWISSVALIVLLIACANVANLLLSRAAARSREIALRLALGVSRRRLARQLLTETLVLASLGGATGLAMAQWGAATLRRAFFTGETKAAVITDPRTLVVAMVGILVTTFLTGIAPLAFALRSDSARALRETARHGSLRSSRTRAALLVIQAALSVVLLVGAGLFVRSLWNVRALRLGYDVSPLVIIAEHMRGVRLTEREHAALEKRLVDAAKAIPGISGATPVASVPFWANEAHPLFVPGIDSVGSRGRFFLQTGNADYFSTIGTRILRGRSFDSRDSEHSPRVAVVSEGMATALWPGVDALGKCFRIGADTAPCTTVIGVAEETRLRSLDEPREFTYYVPFEQYGSSTGMLFVRVAGDGAAYTERVRHQLQQVMPGNAYLSAQPFRDAVDPTMESWRFGATMFVAFGGLALVLAGVGLYGVVAYGVSQRRPELGIRLALGARPTDLVQLVVSGGVRLVLVGVGAGIVLALATARWIAPLLFHESATDPAVYAAVASVLLVVAIVATAAPATAAAHVDPNVALRAD